MALNWEIITHNKMVTQGILRYQITVSLKRYLAYAGLSIIGTFDSQVEAIKACEKYERGLRDG